MASLIELRGGIQRTQDYASIRQNEESRAALQQANSDGVIKNQAEQKANNVHERDNTEFYDRQFDASQKGDNEYYRQEQERKKKKEEKEKDGKVTLKQGGGFDIKI